MFVFGLAVNIEVWQLEVMILVLFLELVDEAGEATGDFTFRVSWSYLVCCDELSSNSLVQLSKPFRIHTLVNLCIMNCFIFSQIVP